MSEAIVQLLNKCDVTSPLARKPRSNPAALGWGDLPHRNSSVYDEADVTKGLKIIEERLHLDDIHPCGQARAGSD